MCVICYNGLYGGDTWQVFTGTRGGLGQHACVGGERFFPSPSNRSKGFSSIYLIKLTCMPPLIGSLGIINYRE